MSRVAAFFSWIGGVVFAGLVAGTFMAWISGIYQGSLIQWLLHELIQAALLGLCVWGAIRSWRRRQALPPAERSKAGMGCLVVICLFVAIVMALGIKSQSQNRKAAEEATVVGPPVIDALARFKAAKKEYPRTLDDLVPQYLPAVPGCKAGETRPRMAYRLDASSGHYELSCPASTVMRYSYRYRSATGEWDLTD